jgi:anti-sigma regulatory factor (Ser/Thr protein kinase)
MDRPFWETAWWRGSDEVRGKIRLAAQQAAAGNVFRETLPYWVADGGERMVDFVMHPIVDSAGVVRFLHPTGIDVTERMRAEKALRAVEAEERQIAVGLQRALLPARLVERPEVSLAAVYEAGSDVLEVGGDWYDAFELPDGRFALTVGDVVGHGLAAAAAMGQVRTALAALAFHAAGPGELLERLDGFLARTKTTDFATVCYAIIDPASASLEYACAGHPPMLVVSPAGETTWLDGAQSAPLSGDTHRSRPQATAVLEPGSLLVLYSDGLVERRKETIDRGLQRLAEAARSVAALPVEEVCRTLVAKLGVDALREDDVAVMALRLEATPTSRYQRRFPAHGDQLRALRASMRCWLDERAVGQPMQQTLLLAVGEACANAIEHAYRDSEPGDVQVEMTQTTGDEFLVQVRDSGSFQPAGPAGDRGRGTEIMKRLAADFCRETTSDGTVVRFRVLSGAAFE